MEASSCAYWCKEPTGCSEPKCEIGHIHCTKRFTGHNDDGLCTKWAKDRSPVCRPAGGCTHLDEYNFCDWAGNKKKPVTTAKCASPACRKNCEAGTDAPAWSFYETGDITLVCETNKSTSACHAPSQMPRRRLVPGARVGAANAGAARARADAVADALPAATASAARGAGAAGVSPVRQRLW
jgi:hypothetical protein